jgi:hypothetical protein
MRGAAADLAGEDDGRHDFRELLHLSGPVTIDHREGGADAGRPVPPPTVATTSAGSVTETSRLRQRLFRDAREDQFSHLASGRGAPVSGSTISGMK